MGCWALVWLIAGVAGWGSGLLTLPTPRCSALHSWSPAPQVLAVLTLPGAGVRGAGASCGGGRAAFASGSGGAADKGGSGGAGAGAGSGGGD